MPWHRSVRTVQAEVVLRRTGGNQQYSRATRLFACTMLRLGSPRIPLSEQVNGRFVRNAVPTSFSPEETNA